MRARLPLGEILLGILFAVAGLFWCIQAMRMPLWSGSAPDSGLLPLAFGGLLVALAIAAVLKEGAHPCAKAEEERPRLRPYLVLIALSAGVAGIQTVGFFGAMFAMMLALFALVERKPVPFSLAASLGVAVLLTTAFRTWLGVPLPLGPWGF